jgi:hypothetical protein
LEASISAFTTCAPSTMTLPPLALMAMVSPLTAFADVSFTTSAAVTRLGTTW